MLDRLEEHDGLDWQLMPSIPREGTQWFLPPPWRGRVPASLSLWAHRP